LRRVTAAFLMKEGHMDAISWQLLIEGAWTTLWISAIAIAFGVVIGLLIALVRMLRLPVIDQLLVVYISLARATPLVTLVLFLFLAADGGD
jgi:polar amino acid transport system permease protein